MVPRHGLFERLDKAARVTQISAPAGSGKTFLVRSWLFESGLADSAALVPVQGGEQDPQRFWISVLDAMRETIIGAKLVRPLTGAPDLDGWAVAERLLEDLGPGPRQVASGRYTPSATGVPSSAVANHVGCRGTTGVVPRSGRPGRP